ncbi:MAG: DUF4070 domain-containing protein [Dehalococcoidales bacterium]|nr:DUF4070 domain-containing protein [Dehalococcoidales bacterium]
MNILMVYPEYPDTFWSFKHALKFVSKKAAFPPLGLLTISSMIPKEWKKKLVDMNVCGLTDAAIKWADYVFISGMVVQKKSAKDVIARCRKMGKKVVAGGPLFTVAYEEFEGVDCFVLDEAETTLPLFLNDLENNRVQHIYTSEERPDIDKTPVPDWSLIDMKKYSSMNIQYSRGCPYDCEFCDIVVLNGRVPRTKSKEQILAELETLYRYGWRSGVFIVDDNFIGNKKKLKTEILPAIVEWSKEKKYPFTFLTEVSINLADDEELMNLMTEAGFNTVFAGIETPNEDSLVECNKIPNKGRDLNAMVKIIQNHGLEVQGGFIVGFDNDSSSIFEKQISFIQKSGICTAMVGLLTAFPRTRLYHRLVSENRLIKNSSGDNTDCSVNFIPKMNNESLINGYKHILRTIYAPKQYYERIIMLLKEYRPPKRKSKTRFQLQYIKAWIKSTLVLGFKDKGRWQYWKLILRTITRYPRAFPLAISLTIYGFHFRKIVEEYTRAPVRKMLPEA